MEVTLSEVRDVISWHLTNSKASHTLRFINHSCAELLRLHSCLKQCLGRMATNMDSINPNTIRSNKKLFLKRTPLSNTNNICNSAPLHTLHPSCHIKPKELATTPRIHNPMVAFSNQLAAILNKAMSCWNLMGNIDLVAIK